MEKRELEGFPNKKSSAPPATMPRIHGGKDTPPGYARLRPIGWRWDPNSD